MSDVDSWLKTVTSAVGAVAGECIGVDTRGSIMHPS